MRSAELDLGKYNTDKVANRYLEKYDPVFEPFVEREVRLLELGVHRGGSLLLWRDYFPKGEVVGIDVRVRVDLSGEKRISVFEGRQDDRAFLSRVAEQSAPGGFDIIIDDASHVGSLTKTAFWHLFDNHLKSGGIYVIEDWGTGYWSDWVDGKAYRERYGNHSPYESWVKLVRGESWKRFQSHDYGMVGFIKELIDEQGFGDLTRASLNGTSLRVSKFESMTIHPSIVFIKKL